jgi:periplasmic protein TonB
MSTTLVASATRQTVTLAAIAGLHLGAFFLVSMGLGAHLRFPPLPGPPIEVFIPPAPPAPPAPPVAPGPVPEPDFGVPGVTRPVIDIPVFEERVTRATGTEASTASAAGTGLATARVEYRAPALRTRDRRLAVLIDACYPAAARRLGEEGRVVARVTIDAGGQPIASSVEETSGFAHLDAGVDCVVRRLEFVPGRRDGRGVEATVLLPILFRLH